MPRYAAVISRYAIICRRCQRDARHDSLRCLIFTYAAMMPMLLSVTLSCRRCRIRVAMLALPALRCRFDYLRCLYADACRYYAMLFTRRYDAMPPDKPPTMMFAATSVLFSAILRRRR